ncbi:M48 family metallopeptidase [uncultured Muribaculum sp.]|uniref:M48 family metallopeptidase n=1 Tax=uncultured Muribaculum sp. TaxID=1918613 RepID=UPI0025D57B03|nr:M48 family metallopeptidase [uncultured Muribaculum sp.]
MKRTAIRILLSFVCMATMMPATAQFNFKKALGGAAKAVQAATLTDEQMAAYVKESVDWMDKNNPVLPDDNPYTIRLKKLTDGITDADGIPLNFKVYDVIDVNAFACPDGSVRVFSSLMDIMGDDELLGIIGHEIGHVMKHHSKNAFRTQLLTDALKDGIASTGGKAAALTESQLGDLGSSLVNAKFSQKQENEADNCGYDFLVAKGKNPWGMVMAFEKFQKMEGENGGKSSYVTKMFSSHPETQARIDNMTKRCQKDGFKRPVVEEKK